MHEDPAEAGPSAGPPSRLRLAPGIGAAAIAVLLYAPTVFHAFAYDDFFILRSPLLARPFDLLELFTGGFYDLHDRYLGLYRPLGQWTLVLNAVLARALTGSFGSPAPYHAVNVLLHAAASFLLFAWLSRLPLPRWVAGATAILWAVHPTHAEVAANVTARYESLAAVFGLSFLIAHRSRKGFLGALLFLCSLWCKESAIALLPLALAVDALFPVGERRFSARTLLPSVAVLGLWFLLRAIALADESPATPFVQNPVALAGLRVRLATAAAVQLLYLRDQLLPLWLSSDHSYDQIRIVRSFADPACLGFLLLLACAAFAAWRGVRSGGPLGRGLALGVLGYAIAFAPSCNFVVPIGTLMADRLAYLPSIFTCLLGAIALSAVKPAPLRSGGVAAAALLLCAASFAQARTWKDELTLFREQVRTAPRSAKSHQNYGYALHRQGELAAAVEEYRKAIEIYPYWPEPHGLLAQAYDLLGAEPEVRIVAWADSIRYGTLGERPVLQRALALVDLGRWSDLDRLRGEMASADPRDPFLPRVAGILRAGAQMSSAPGLSEERSQGDERLRRGDFAGAEEAYRRALHGGAVPPQEMGRTLRSLAQCHERLGHPARARHFQALAASVDGRP